VAKNRAKRIKKQLSRTIAKKGSASEKKEGQFKPNEKKGVREDGRGAKRKTDSR